MSLKTRLLKVEKAWYSLEAEHYSKSWQELYDHDKDARKEREEFENLVETASPPYWFWPAKDEWQRKFGWAMSKEEEANALFDDMFDRLKRFVDCSQASSDENHALAEKHQQQ